MGLFADIREGLVANLAPLGIQSTGYLLGSPLSPAVELFPGETVYDLAHQRGIDTVLFTIRVREAVPLDEGAQVRMDEYLEPRSGRSVKTLVETDTTLGGKVKDLRIEGATGHEVAVVEGQQILSCDWTVRIYV